jgi:DNA ligase-1
VIAHQPGNGKYAGLLGSVLVETGDGKRFRIGSGFSDEQRHNPPPLGSVITYKYFGVTANGIPRFASFLRVREER